MKWKSYRLRDSPKSLNKVNCEVSLDFSTLVNEQFRTHQRFFLSICTLNETNCYFARPSIIVKSNLIFFEKCRCKKVSCNRKIISIYSKYFLSFTNYTKLCLKLTFFHINVFLSQSYKSNFVMSKNGLRSLNWDRICKCD